MVFMKTDMLQVVLLQMSETTCHASVWQSEEFSSFQDFFFFFFFSVKWPFQISYYSWPTYPGFSAFGIDPSQIMQS